MLGGDKKSRQNLEAAVSKYLINFNAPDWASQANNYLQNALQQGLAYSEKYSQGAVDTAQAFQKQSEAAQQSGYEMAQALNAPKRLAAYNALDSYLGTLGQAQPVGGSFQLASALANAEKQKQGLLDQPLQPNQAQLAAAFNQGLLGPPRQEPAIFNGGQ